jgi:hypothetical protein
MVGHKEAVAGKVAGEGTVYEGVLASDDEGDDRSGARGWGGCQDVLRGVLRRVDYPPPDERTPPSP